MKHLRLLSIVLLLLILLTSFTGIGFHAVPARADVSCVHDLYRGEARHSAKDSYYGSHLSLTGHWCYSMEGSPAQHHLIRYYYYPPFVEVCCGWDLIGDPHIWTDRSDWPHSITRKVTQYVKGCVQGVCDTQTLWIQFKIEPGNWVVHCSGWIPGKRSGCDTGGT